MALLEVRNVSVRFGGLQALDEVNVSVNAGHVTGLIGPNGAGKTTLFNVITGLQTPTSGDIVLDDVDLTLAKPHRRARSGIGRTFQRLETFGSLSARDNVLVGAEMRRGWSRERFDPREFTNELIERVGLSAVADEIVDTLPTGTARLVEVARALASKPKVLLLDEPSSGLTANETTALGELLREISISGVGVLLVEHDMSFVMGTCEKLYVLDFGRIISTGSPAEVQANSQVRSAYLGSSEGTPVAQIRSRSTTHLGSNTPSDQDLIPALSLKKVDAAYGLINVLSGVDLEVKSGQVFALLGPNGAGKSTTLKVASGQLKPTAGQFEIDGISATSRSADWLARNGICLIPEGRGVFPNLTIIENLKMATFTGTPYGEIVEKAFARFPRLKERSKQLAGTLSGGEQQMLAMARALATNPKVLLLDELSMGLAPLIVEELYEIVRGIADDNVSILIVEQFAHEILTVADTAAIMLHGRIEFTGSPEEVGTALEQAYLGGSVNGGTDSP